MKKIFSSAVMLLSAALAAQTTGIGTTAPNAATQLHVVKTETASNSGNSFGIQTDLTTAAQASVRGLANTVTYTASGGTGSALGVYSQLNDASTSPHTSYGAYFGNTVSVGKTNTDAFTHGLWSDVTINPASGSINTPFAYGGQATARAVASTGDITLSTLRGYSGYAIPTAASGRTVTMDDLYGAHLTARPTVNGGTINLKNLFGVSAQFDDSGSGGALNITGDAAALRALVALGNGTTKSIKNLYGLLVNYNPGNAGNTVNNAYGVYINPISGSANPYNFYSAGSASRNRLEGALEINGTVKMTNLPLSNEATDKVLVSDAQGNVKAKDASALSTVVATNGLTQVGNVISLGGNTTGDIEINAAGSEFSIINGFVSLPNGSFYYDGVDLGRYSNAPTLSVSNVSGNVGIGTTSPSEKLEVAGNVKANQFIASTGTFPDYVFQNYYTGTASKLNPSYKFTSLNETEKFIKENGHLPGFESAAEVVKKGEFNVSDTSLKSVEKIEELYLHMIELEKRVQQLENENSVLRKSNH